MQDIFERIIARLLNLPEGGFDLYIAHDEIYQAEGDVTVRELTIEEGGVLDMLDFKLTVTKKYQYLPKRFLKCD